MPKIQNAQQVIIRFAGDSGDGMQVTGIQFSNTAASLGNDVRTQPDYPAEIRAPIGTLAGVSGFQVNMSSERIHTPGDKIQVLVAMNPAALKTNMQDLEAGGILLINSNAFQEKDLNKAQYTHNPLQDPGMGPYRIFQLPLTDLTLNAVKNIDISHSASKKSKNMFALGIVYWLCDMPLTETLDWISGKFSDTTAQANTAALKAGYHYAETVELFDARYHVPKAKLSKGIYRHVTGNEALALGVVALAQAVGREVFMSGYPITPASSVLHELSHYRDLGIQTFQAEDEIAALCACIGAAYGGHPAISCTSGPGLDLKTEALGLAVMAELPLILIDIQRSGPSTGMPTKSEQTDLLTAIYGRHGESPMPVLAVAKPGECFSLLLQAYEFAVKAMTPVIILSDGNLAMGAEPWLIPSVDSLPNLKKLIEDQSSLWNIPGRENKAFTLGGIEKDLTTGHISYDPDNHHAMTQKRQAKITALSESIPPLEILGATQGKLLVIGWGSTYGSILSAIETIQSPDIGYIHLRHLNPLPNDLFDLVEHYDALFIPELNSGQLSTYLKGKINRPIYEYHKVSGKPFLIDELRQQLESLL